MADSGAAGRRTTGRGGGLLPFATSASAEVNPNFYEELTAVNQKAVVNFLYEQSPQATVPYTEEAAVEGSEALLESYEELPEQQKPVFAYIVGGVNTLVEDAKLAPAVELGVPEIIATGGGAFVTGYLIGTGIHAIIGEVGLPFGSAPEEKFLGAEGFEFCYSHNCEGELQWHPYGYDIYYGGTIQQKPGAYTYSGTAYHYGERYGYFGQVRWFEPPCPSSDFSPPPYANLGLDPSTEAHCWTGSESAPVEMVYPYITKQQVLSLKRFHHFNPLTEPEPEWRVKAPEDPGFTVVYEAAEEALDQSEGLQAWLGSTFEPATRSESLPAPTATKKKVDDEERRCDRGSGPTFYNLDGNNGPTPFEVKEPPAFTVTDLPEGIESPSPVYLRWGETSWLGEALEEPQFMDLWGGWGYRHIQAKHGWNALDREETALALLTPQKPVKGIGTNWVYSTDAIASGVGGAECERRVVVQFEKGFEEDPAPRGIVTSYNVAR